MADKKDTGVYTVKIKRWDTMVREFGTISEEGSKHIDCSGDFVDKMEEDLPQDRVIQIIREPDESLYRWYVNEIDDSSWQISDDMIEKIIE